MAARTPGQTTKLKKTAAALQREQRIEAYQERIRKDEGDILALEEERSALSHTDLVDLTVRHKSFGFGTVVAQDAQTITVRFDLGDKRFIMPSAFTNGFLSTADAETNGKLAQYQDMGTRIRAVKDDISKTRRALEILESK